MGLKTDFMSLGAIGLGTAVAVIGTGGVLIAGALHQVEDQARAQVSCVDVADLDINRNVDMVEVVTTPRAKATVVEVSGELRDVVKAPEAPDALPGLQAPSAPDAPEGPNLHATRIVVSSDVQVEIGECADELRDMVSEIRIHAEEARAQARESAADARATATEARAQAEAARALALEVRTQAMEARDAALADVARAEARRR